MAEIPPAPRYLDKSLPRDTLAHTPRNQCRLRDRLTAGSWECRDRHRDTDEYSRRGRPPRRRCPYSRYITVLSPMSSRDLLVLHPTPLPRSRKGSSASRTEASHACARKALGITARVRTARESLGARGPGR